MQNLLLTAKGVLKLGEKFELQLYIYILTVKT